MIPDHLIDQAARAAYESNRVGKWTRLEWEDLDRYTQDEYLKNARAALETVAAELYDEGYEYGRGDGDCMSYTLPGERPYRASEEA